MTFPEGAILLHGFSSIFHGHRIRYLPSPSKNKKIKIYLIKIMVGSSVICRQALFRFCRKLKKMDVSFGLGLLYINDWLLMFTVLVFTFY